MECPIWFTRRLWFRGFWFIKGIWESKSLVRYVGDQWGTHKFFCGVEGHVCVCVPYILAIIFLGFWPGSLDQPNPWGQAGHDLRFGWICLSCRVSAAV